MAKIKRTKPLVVHIIYRLDTGGMENGLINLINGMPEEFCDHTIVCLTEYSDFRNRITRQNVQVYALHKKPGHDFGIYFRLWSLLRKLGPEIVHTRNLAALEMNIIALLAGVKRRVHGEHGRDIYDLDGSNWKYRLVRRFCRFFVSRYITVSKDLYQWLVHDLKIPEKKVTQIYNGVDNDRFKPVEKHLCRKALPAGFNAPECFIVGTVGRLQAVKNQQYLINAFALMIDQNPEIKTTLRLILVGDGNTRQQLEDLVNAEGIQPYVWFAGDQSDVPVLLSAMDLFILPSLAEGISNTILEAMASGLPVVATNVGGNPELVEDNVTGRLVAVNSVDELASVLLSYFKDESLRIRQGENARSSIKNRFSMKKMLSSYQQVYQSCFIE
ncbi:MAG: TIGR03088 family PEP-CTERM/XrtA system glycosyltransferase [Gammaproteobacteria bacterium]|nr:TIGR03088 family PEP-CTERM/XrtA system glycosyltransferase [Gammaproteobacteria bacterium]